MSSADDGSTDPTGGRDLVLRRGTAATALLRRAARVAHEDSLPISALPPIHRPKGGVEAGDGGWFSVFIRISFLLVFVIPVFAELFASYAGIVRCPGPDRGCVPRLVRPARGTRVVDTGRPGTPPAQ